MSRIALLDGDILVYAIAAASEEVIDWGDGQWSIYTDEDTAKQNLDTWICELVEACEADDFLVCLSDPDKNWRKDVLPTYKSNRANTRPPMLRKVLDTYLRDRETTKWKPGLEADDVMGIMSTNPKILPSDQKVIVSIDKDLRTIPGFLFNWRKKEEGIVQVSENEADYYHLYQTLIGDKTDGYAGCPGIGPARAEKILFGACPPYGTPEEAWAAVVAAYKSKKFGEEEALTQARVARILRHGEFNYKTGEVKLWTPS